MNKGNETTKLFQRLHRTSWVSRTKALVADSYFVQTPNNFGLCIPFNLLFFFAGTNTALNATKLFPLPEKACLTRQLWCWNTGYAYRNSFKQLCPKHYKGTQWHAGKTQSC